MVSPKSRISLGALFYCFNIPFFSVKSNEVYLSPRWPTNEICMQLNRLLRVCLALWLSVPVFQNRKPVQNFSWHFKALTSQKYKSCRPGRSVICFFWKIKVVDRIELETFVFDIFSLLPLSGSTWDVAVWEAIP